MLQNFLALALGIGFLVLFSRDFPLPLPAAGMRVLLFALLATTMNFIFLRRGIKKLLDLTKLLFPVLYILAVAMVIFLLPAGWFRLFIVAFTAAILVGIERKNSGSFSSAYGESLFVFTAAGLFLGIWATDFYYRLSWWAIVGLLSSAVFLLQWIAFYPIGTTYSRKLLFSATGVVLLAECAWILLFWSAFFVPTAILFTIFFYLVWILFKSQLEANITFKKIIFQSSVAVLAVAIIMATTNWLPPK